eukprot:s2556_g10.t1
MRFALAAALALWLQGCEEPEAVEVASAAALTSGQRLLQSRLQDVRRYRKCDATQAAPPRPHWDSSSPAEEAQSGDTVHRSKVLEAGLQSNIEQFRVLGFRFRV